MNFKRRPQISSEVKQRRLGLLVRIYDHIRDEINYFLDKLFPSRGTHLPYPEAEKCIQKSKLDPDTKEQMLFLLKKMSRGAGLDTAAQRLREPIPMLTIGDGKNIG